MGYLYENSTPDRFQHLCQTLLLETYPELQCFPVAQKDGGRDGLDLASKTVLQVKFRRNDEEESAEWMISALEGELPKIKQLIARGATKYVMVTNARPTAHLGVGRIDKVQKWLEDNVSIPAVCLWRDDLDRRLDAAGTPLKLRYSELLTLEDGLDVLLLQLANPKQQAQQDAIKFFVLKQFNLDRDVKFKQVQLSSDLLDLFIDVPVGFPRKQGERTRKATDDRVNDFLKSKNAIRGFYFDQDSDFVDVVVPTEEAYFRRLDMGAAEFLLDDAAQKHLPLVMLEGAPGQGKSTLAQYVCQVHRARFLGDSATLAQIPHELLTSSFRLPVKVDLRDLATFINGEEPFPGIEVPTAAPRSLEAFVAHLINFRSGMNTFEAEDVVSVVQNAPTLFFLDGLDEVPDLSTRESIVQAVGDALGRWEILNADTQVVVTSRPSVFGRRPNLARHGFTTLTLRDIDRERIDKYADQWTRASELEPPETTAVLHILSQKLELAHIRDLTRNPMQLTILLSLIHQVGHSLPDQRTDLYSRYIDTFLTREADKDARVREHRPLLLSFLGYLAWVLQTAAESSGSAGSISAASLQELATQYLRTGSYDTQMADDLFDGGLERVFVLVERIEGLYEFEVQPLREFFCAEYLYSTAPVGTYRQQQLRGDRAQRFEALAANPFWLNVCRFYAGFCERGETGTLVLSLQEAIQSDDPGLSIHSRRVALALLQDWVFSNTKYPQGELIDAIFDGPASFMLLMGDGFGTDDIRLEKECGRDHLRDLLFEHLLEWPADHRTGLLCSLIAQNGGSELTPRFLGSIDPLVGRLRSNMIIRMVRSGAVSLSEQEFLNLVMADSPSRSELARRLFEYVCSNFVSVSIDGEARRLFIELVLDGWVPDSNSPRNALEVFAATLSTGMFGVTTRLIQEGIRLVRYEMVLDDKDSMLTPPVSDFFERCKLAAEGRAETFGPRHPSHVSEVIEASRVVFGETWAGHGLALRTAGVRLALKLHPQASAGLFDQSVPLFDRTRAARLRRSGPVWWTDQLDRAETRLDERLWAGLVLLWASADNLRQLSDQLSMLVDGWSEAEFESTLETVRSISSKEEPRSDRKKILTFDLSRFSNRAAVLTAVALSLPSDRVSWPRGKNTEPLRTFRLELALSEKVAQLPNWRDPSAVTSWGVDLMQHRQTATIPSKQLAYSRIKLPASLSPTVIANPETFPVEFLTPAVMGAQKLFSPQELAARSQAEDWDFV